MLGSVQDKSLNKILLVILLVVAAILRLHKLGNESLWLDELHTILETNPHVSWSEFFDFLRCCEPHPPLFFFLERITFSILGYEEQYIRIIPALSGVATVWATYKLGKEVLNERLGLIAALITTVNYYSVSYSQDARGYGLLWLFTVLSFCYFIRLAKNLDRKSAIWYILSTALLLYTHYFSLFVILCQLVLFCILLLAEEGNRKKFFLTVLYSELIVLSLYSPLIPWRIMTSKTSSFWITQPPQNFYVDYFHEYFGSTAYLYPFLYIAMIIYFVRVFSLKADFKNLKTNPEFLSAVMIICTIFTVYGAAYIRSVVSVPMLISRYTVVLVPIFILCIAYGFYMIENRTLRNIVLFLFFSLSLFDLIYDKKYYRTTQNSQFREVTKFVVDVNKRIPLINSMAAWQQGYYLNKFGYEGPVWAEKKEDLVDSILAKTSPKYTIDTFWIVGVHNDRYLEADKRRELEKEYMVVKHETFKDCWAELWYKIVWGPDEEK